MRCVERVAHEHGVGARGVELAVGLVGEVVRRQLRSAAQPDRRVEVRFLRDDDADGRGILRCVQLRLALKTKNPFSLRRNGFLGLSL
jgi:hypothetical protein